MIEGNFIWYLLLFDIFVPTLFSYLDGVNYIKRCEEYLREFYWVLREKYPRSYVKQNKMIIFVRKHCKLKTEGSIHWMIFFAHYVQVFMAISPAFLLITLPFAFSETLIILFAIIEFAVPFSFIAILVETATTLQAFRCDRIKKKDPSYSKRKVYYWHKGL